MNQEEILTKYNNEMSKIRNRFPLENETLKQNHKSILSKILPPQTKNSLTSNIQKQIDTSFKNYKKKMKKNILINLIHI